MSTQLKTDSSNQPEAQKAPSEVRAMDERQISKQEKETGDYLKRVAELNASRTENAAAIARLQVKNRQENSLASKVKKKAKSKVMDYIAWVLVPELKAPLEILRTMKKAIIRSK